MEYFNIARVNMVKNQIMPNKVNNAAVLEAFESIPRHEFVEGNWQSFAYSDARLPVNANRKMLAPDVLARMIDALKLTKKCTVLDIASATGYSTALLAKLCKHVIAIENDSDLVSKCENNLLKLGLENAEVKKSEPLKGDHKNAPYDAILIASALTTAPEHLISQLKIDGKLVYIKIVSEHLCKAMLAKNLGHSFGEIELFDTFCEPWI